MNNSYVPVKAEIIEVIQETSSDVDIKTFKIKLVDDEKMDFLPGQFVELKPGVGRPLVSSSP